MRVVVMAAAFVGCAPLDPCNSALGDVEEPFRPRSKKGAPKAGPPRQPSSVLISRYSSCSPFTTRILTRQRTAMVSK
jgi:hypothetical protein